MRKRRRLEDQYRFGEFGPDPVVRGIFGDPKARIVRSVRDLSCGDARVHLEFA